MKNAKILIQLILVFSVLTSCKNNCTEDCSNAVDKSLESVFKEDFIKVANNVNLENDYYKVDDPNELKDDVVFNIDLRNKSYQLTHIDLCDKGAFAIMGLFEGELSQKYTSESISLMVRNVFSVSGEYYKIAKVEEAFDSGFPIIHLKVTLEKGTNIEPIQKIPVPVNLKQKNVFEKNTRLDISLFMSDENGEIVEFMGCGKLKSKDGKVYKDDFGGDACNANMSY